MDAQTLIEHYDLQPHPEGGHFKEIYRSSLSVRAEGFDEARQAGTSIYFLLKAGEVSHFHRLKSDEIWHFYLGGPLTLVQIHEDGTCHKTVMGQDLSGGQKVQCVIPGHVWFGAYLNEGTDFSFVGCTVSPGFEFADFEMAKRSDLMETYPQHNDIIKTLTI